MFVNKVKSFLNARIYWLMIPPQNREDHVPYSQRSADGHLLKPGNHQRVSRSSTAPAPRRSRPIKQHHILLCKWNGQPETWLYFSLQRSKNLPQCDMITSYLFIYIKSHTSSVCRVEWRPYSSSSF